MEQADGSKSVKLREDWRKRSKPIPPGGTYPAKDHCSRCGLCDTYYIAHVKDACAFLGDGMSRIEVSLLQWIAFLLRQNIQLMLLDSQMLHISIS